jgi:hypothetical protein
MRTIDLIPPDILARRETQSCIRRWAKRLVLSALVATVLYGGLCGLAAGRNAELLQLTDRYEALEESLHRAGGLLRERDLLAKNEEAIALIRGNQTAGWALEILGQTLTPDSYLSYLRIDHCPFYELEDGEDEEANPCLETLTIRGQAPGHQQVGQILHQLVTSGAFPEVALVSASETNAIPGQEKVDFEIFCAMTGGDTRSRAPRYGPLEAEL